MWTISNPAPFPWVCVERRFAAILDDCHLLERVSISFRYPPKKDKPTHHTQKSNKEREAGDEHSVSNTEISYYAKSPGSGALNSLFLAKNEEYGRTPSRPYSGTTSIFMRLVQLIRKLRISYLCLGWTKLNWEERSRR